MKGKKKPRQPKVDYSKPLEYGVGPGKALIHYAPTKKRAAEVAGTKAGKKASMKEEMDYLGYDAYDVVLEYLLQTEQVSSIEEANYVMTEMEGTTINEILNEMVPLLGGIVKAGKTIGKAMKKMKKGAGAMAVGAGVGAAGAGIGKKIKQGGKKAGEAMKGAAKVGAGGAVGGQASRKMRGE